MIAGEGPDRDGHYVMEDAHWVEICDLDTAQPVPDGQTGDLIVTCLFKDDVYPIIRFNTHDVSAFRTDKSSIGVQFKRIEGFLGRSDNMVKVRGINIFPQAIGPMLDEAPEFLKEFVCKTRRDAVGRDTFVVVAEATVPGDPALAARFGEILKRKIGIEVAVELVGRSETAALTQIDVRQKPIRLIDERF
jgi:phenylacetate-CoA ligase